MTQTDDTNRDGYFSVLRLRREDLINLYPSAFFLDDSDMEGIAESMSEFLMEYWSEAMYLALALRGYETQDSDDEDSDIYEEDEFDTEDEDE